LSFRLQDEQIIKVQERLLLFVNRLRMGWQGFTRIGRLFSTTALFSFF